MKERIRVEDRPPQLHKAFGRYDELYEVVPVGLMTLDRVGRILDLNERAARILAFPSSWLARRPFVVFVAKHDIRRFLAFLTRSANTSEQQTIDLNLSVNSRDVPVQISLKSLKRERSERKPDRAQPSTDDGALIYHMTIVDLTDTKRIEQQLEEALANWHSLVHNVPDVIMTVDRSGKIIFANRAAWGRSSSALLGTRLTDHVAEKYRPKLQKCIVQAFNTQGRSTCEVKGAGEQRDSWYGFSFAPAKNGTGKGDRKTTTLVIREISEHKRAEESLRSSGEQMREFAAKLEAVREEERTRMAREIHDELGQALTILKLDLSWLHMKTPSAERDRRKKMKSMIEHVDQTIGRIREIVSELRPAILDDLGLAAAIEWQLAQFEKRTGIRTVFESSIERFDFSPDVAAALFRVVQEALTNVVRHTKASKVSVSMKASGETCRIFIEDNGKGITVEQINDLRSLGIVGMKERIHRIQGEFKISAPPGRGTQLEITVSTPRP